MKLLSHIQRLSLATCLLYSSTAALFATNSVADDVFDLPILIVGASFENSLTPLQDDFTGPLNGFAVSVGEGLSIGAALVRDPLTQGLVINEARAGAGTFDRLGCAQTPCTTAQWQSFANQFEKALLRVALRNPDNPAEITGYNAHYVYIGLPNDCLHSDAFGIPQAETQPCTTQDFNNTVDAIKAVAERALEVGITPVISVHPNFADYDLSITTALFNFEWMIDEASYNEMRDLQRTRLAAEVPDALLIDAWDYFKHSGDGLHPDSHTSRRAAHQIASAIKQHAWQQQMAETQPKLKVQFNQDNYLPGEQLQFSIATYAPADATEYDLYAVLVFPQGYFVAFSDNPFALQLPDIISPYQTGLSLATMQRFNVANMTVMEGMSAGTYSGCGILTASGADPWQAENRLALVCEEVNLLPIE